MSIFPLSLFPRERTDSVGGGAEVYRMNLPADAPVSFRAPRPFHQAVVDVNRGALSIRARPAAFAPVLARARDGAELTVLNRQQAWFLVRFNGVVGYAGADSITLV